MEEMMMAPVSQMNAGLADCTGGWPRPAHSSSSQNKKRAENTEALGAADHVAAYVPARLWKIKNKKIGPKKE